MIRRAHKYKRILARTEPVTIWPFFFPDSQGLTAFPKQAWNRFNPTRLVMGFPLLPNLRGLIFLNSFPSPSKNCSKGWIWQRIIVNPHLVGVGGVTRGDFGIHAERNVSGAAGCIGIESEEDWTAFQAIMDNYQRTGLKAIDPLAGFLSLDSQINRGIILK